MLVYMNSLVVHMLVCSVDVCYLGNKLCYQATKARMLVAECSI